MAVSSSALARRPDGSGTARSRPPRSYRRSAELAGRLLRQGAAESLRWLQADVGGAIRMQAEPSPRRATPVPGELRDSLLAWASTIRQRRALAIARRHLIAALGVAIAAELVVVLAGGDRRAWWLLVPLALALADGTIALRRPVRLDRVAHMLDRSLGLRDLLSTACAIAGDEPQPRGLAALVVQEAAAAAGESFRSVRLTTRQRRLELALLAAGVAVLAALAATPGIGGHGSTRHAEPPATRASSAALARAHAKPSKLSPGERRERAPAASGTLARPPLAVATGESRQSKGSGFSPYGHGANSLSAKQLAKEGIARPPTATTKALGALAVGESGGGSSTSSAGASGTSSAVGSKGTPGSGTSAATTHGATSATGAGALAPAHSRGAGAAAGAGTKPAGVGAGGASQGNSPPGGNAAGTGSASTALGNGLVPALGAGPTGLPLQAGYAPSAAQRASGSEGVSQTPNGGGSGGRSAHTSAGGGTSVSSSLSVIPPTFNSTPTLDQGVLSSYFGSANQLTPASW
jgi:hypothetical protein